MLWTLSDGTEIQAADNSEPFNIYVPISDRSLFWDFVETNLDGKDLSSFTLTGNGETQTCENMVFMGLTILEPNESTIHLHFSTGLAEHAARLEREVRELRGVAETSADKAAAYDILMGNGGQMS